MTSQYQFLYNDSDYYYFMNNDDYNQITIEKTKIDYPDLLKEGENVTIIINTEDNNPPMTPSIVLEGEIGDNEWLPNFKNASSILYISISGTNPVTIDITLLLISPYNLKFEEKTSTLFSLNIFLYLNAGAPIGIPRDFASLLRAITQPSLLDKTTIGLLIKLGWNTLSQEA